MAALWISFFGGDVVSFQVLNSVLHMASRFINRRHLSWPDKAGGFCLGSCHGIIIVSFFLTGFMMIPIPGLISKRINRSTLTPSALAIVPLVFDSIAPHVVPVPDSHPFTEQLNVYLGLPTSTTTISLNSMESFIQMLPDLFPDSR